MNWTCAWERPWQTLPRPPSRRPSCTRSSAACGAWRGARWMCPITEEMLMQGARAEEDRRLLRQLAPTAALIVPLWGARSTEGALAVISAESGRDFNAEDISLAEDLAARAAVAMENAR